MEPWAELYTVRNLRQDTIPKVLHEHSVKNNMRLYMNI